MRLVLMIWLIPMGTIVLFWGMRAGWEETETKAIYFLLNSNDSPRARNSRPEPHARARKSASPVQFLTVLGYIGGADCDSGTRFGCIEPRVRFLMNSQFSY